MADGKPINVLLVEDEIFLSRIYRDKLKRAGLEITTAHDGEEGLIKAKQGNFDIILVDLIMPKLDGFAVLKQLRAWPQYQKTPIMLLTNISQNEDIKKSKSLGAAGYLVKANFTPAQAAKKIKQFLHK